MSIRIWLLSFSCVLIFKRPDTTVHLIPSSTTSLFQIFHRLGIDSTTIAALMERTPRDVYHILPSLSVHSAAKFSRREKAPLSQFAEHVALQTALTTCSIKFARNSLTHLFYLQHLSTCHSRCAIPRIVYVGSRVVVYCALVDSYGILMGNIL